MSDKLTDPSAQPSEEAKAAAERVNEALQADCVHGLRNHRSEPSSKWDCWGCTGDVVAAEVDRVSREALERAAQKLESMRPEHPCDIGYCAEACFHDVYEQAADEVRALIPGGG